jgi:hypothetical protein
LVGVVTAAALAVFCLLATSAQATPITVGSPLIGEFTSGEVGAEATAFNQTLVEPGAHVTSPVNGVIVSWRIVGATGPFKLRVLRPTGGTTYTAVGTSATETPPFPGLITFATSLPIRAGDTVGIDTLETSKIGALKALGAGVGAWSPPLADGMTKPFLGVEPNIEFGFNASVQPAPAITSVSPNSGSLKGKTNVTIVGSDFVSVSAVSFGGVPATSFAVDSEGQISAVSPAGKNGATDIAVTTIAGTSAATTADQFTYTACVVPKLKGKKLKGTKKRLRNADCKIGKVKKIEGATAKTGKVVKQNPKPGKVLAPGAKIKVTLG